MTLQDLIEFLRDETERQTLTEQAITRCILLAFDLGMAAGKPACRHPPRLMPRPRRDRRSAPTPLRQTGRIHRWPPTRKTNRWSSRNDVGWCRGCGQRRVLCAFGQCVQCHYDSSKQGRREARQPGHLCCGWYATGKLLEGGGVQPAGG